LFPVSAKQRLVGCQLRQPAALLNCCAFRKAQ
jgi:hypothetical protein